VIISVKNHSRIPDAEVLTAVRAVNRQIAEDFEPYWDLGAILRVTDPKAKPLQADAIIRIYPHGHDYHWTPTGLPEGHVFTTLSQLALESVPWLTWTTSLSHEALELIADPQLNTLVQGPHPVQRGRLVFHYREVCDPVQSETYQIDGINVSNFVLPHYYNSLGESGGRNDFLGTGLQAFRWNENGVIGFWDPRQGPRGKYVTWPQYDRSHVVAQRSRLKGPTGRLYRYAHPRVSGPSR
jgi:hypothetical protein